MQFLADLFLTCDACKGKKYKREVLDVRFRGKNIDDVLGMTVTEAIVFFQEDAGGRKVAQKLKVLEEVGLGYLRLGQSATSLSEAKRSASSWQHISACRRPTGTFSSSSTSRRRVFILMTSRNCSAVSVP